MLLIRALIHTDSTACMRYLGSVSPCCLMGDPHFKAIGKMKPETVFIDKSRSSILFSGTLLQGERKSTILTVCPNSLNRAESVF